MKRSLLTAGLFSALTAAQSLSVDIDYASVLDVYYYFRRGEATAALNDYGIEIEANYSSNAELCSVLGGAQLVYSTGSSGDTLLTANCDSVYHLVDAQAQEISWDSCQEFSFYSTLCPSASSSALGSSTSAAASVSISNSETFVLTTVTTTIDGLVTSYTSYCPLTGTEEATTSPSSLSAAASSTVSSTQSSSTGTTVVQAAVLETKTYVYTDNGSVTSYTSLIAVSGNGESKTFVSNTDYYQTTSSQAASTKSAESSILSTVTTTKDNVLTTYTTYCPLSSSGPDSTQESTTTEVSSSYPDSALTTVYTTINGVVTSYTTYCPLSTESGSTVSPTLESASGTSAETTQTAKVSTPTGSALSSQSQEASPSTLDSSSSTAEGTVLVASSGVMTTNTYRESGTATTVKASSQTQTAGSSATSASSVESAHISVYEAGAGKAVVSVSLLYFASFIMSLF